MKLSAIKLVAGGAAIAAVSYFFGQAKGYDMGGKDGFAIGMDTGEMLWAFYILRKYGDDTFNEITQGVGDVEDALQNDPDWHDTANLFMYSIITMMSPEEWSDLSDVQKVKVMRDRIRHLTDLHSQQLWQCIF